jgi:hypothetical protein
MKKQLCVVLFAMFVFAVSASAQTATGTLTVTATVNSSISLVFNSDASGVALSSGGGTNAATLAFGSVSAYGAVGAGVTRTVAASNFTVSTPVDVFVAKSNSASANYTLNARLGVADAVNTWQVAGNTVTSAAATTITATGAYGANAAQAIALTIPFTTASGTNISNTINFSATAN